LHFLPGCKHRNDPLLVPLGVTTSPPGVFVRSLTLNETFDVYGRLIQLLGTNVPRNNRGHGFGRAYTDPATDRSLADRESYWRHAPNSLPPVNVQIISRQPFKVSSYNGTPTYTGAARPPEPNEAGWKDTIRMNPEEVTTVIMQCKLPSVPFAVPSSPRTGGNEYVWHCYILEHQEHDIMRPLVVR
jgi:spore coat protein A, manganese oxidase